jgi:superfamily II DNA or RNA helicase
MKQSYNWQNTAFARFARAAYFAIVADCGVGKTFAAMRIALTKKMPVIVIAPGHRLCGQWKDAILQDAGPNEEVWVYSKPEETAQSGQYKEKFEKWLTA